MERDSRTDRVAGPEMRMTATPEGGAPDDRATMVSLSGATPYARQVFIESKKSEFVLV